MNVYSSYCKVINSNKFQIKGNFKKNIKNFTGPHTEPSHLHYNKYIFIYSFTFQVLVYCSYLWWGCQVLFPSPVVVLYDEMHINQFGIYLFSIWFPPFSTNKSTKAQKETI